MSVAAALAAATSIPASLLSLGEEVGYIRVGRKADLVAFHPDYSHELIHLNSDSARIDSSCSHVEQERAK